MQGLELTSGKCISTGLIIPFDKGAGKCTTTKSICTQYDPLYLLNKLKTAETRKNDLKVKWFTS